MIQVGGNGMKCQRCPPIWGHESESSWVMSAPKAAAVSGPSSRARRAFHDNSDDVRSLFTLHQAAKDSAVVQRHLGPANKGTYLLIAALWETYCEDVVLETMDELLVGTSDPKTLPVAIRRAIAKDLKGDKHELSPWQLAGEGWRQLARDRARRLCTDAVFNSPKTGNVDELFKKTLGITELSKCWTTDRVADARTALDDHLTQRGNIAHRAATTSVTKRQVSDFYQLVMDLTKSMDTYLGVFVLDATGADPFAVATGPF